MLIDLSTFVVSTRYIDHWPSVNASAVAMWLTNDEDVADAVAAAAAGNGATVGDVTSTRPRLFHTRVHTRWHRRSHYIVYKSEVPHSDSVTVVTLVDVSKWFQWFHMYQLLLYDKRNISMRFVVY